MKSFFKKNGNNSAFMQTNHLLTVHEVYTAELATRQFEQLRKNSKIHLLDLSDLFNWRFTRASGENFYDLKK